MKIYILMLLISILSITPASACQCLAAAHSPAAAVENMKNAVFIFDGEILDVTGEDIYTPKVKLKIGKLYKGPAKLDSVEAQADPTTCNIYKLEKGAKDFYILYQSKYGLVTAALCDSYIDTYPLHEWFASRKELEKWAEHSTPGGGHIEDMELEGHKLLAVYRNYTPGTDSADIGVYGEKDGAWQLVKSAPPVYGSGLLAVKANNVIGFTTPFSNESWLAIFPSDLKILKNP